MNTIPRSSEAFSKMTPRSENHSIVFSLLPRTYNLGPRVVCFPHVNFTNFPFGLCAITAIGDFNPSKGGHLVLWDCKLVIEFPPGSTILILSAVLTHSNAKVASHETRFSFSQYSAGGLFRWVDHGFQTVVSYRASLTKEECEALDACNQAHWEFGLNLLPKLPSANLC